ncbi:hypothetical protein NW752_005443 [Fusarium irregulare]|nr:hypothetical protein NW752_005443 [Fusarium irregulare]
MAEILGLASSIITVVGVAGKLGTSTIRLKRLWDEVQDVPASVQRCIEHLELLAPALEEMDNEFQRITTMVQNDSAAKRSLEYSRKAVAALESLVRSLETQLTTAKKGRRLVAQLKVRMKKEVIEEHQQQLQSVLQLVTLSQQTYLIIGAVLLSMTGSIICICQDLQTLDSIWTENKETLLKEVFDGQPYINKVATVTKFWDSILHLTTAESFMLEHFINWEFADPVLALEAMSQEVVSVVDMRATPKRGCQLQDFAIQYLHEYFNCSPLMDEWRLTAQKLFRGATWEDLAALHIDKIVKFIWKWQFPLGAFAKWINRVLGILKEDLSQAGFQLTMAPRFYGVPSRKESLSGLGTMWILTSDCAALWDPYVEELAGEFWYMIETTPLALPGSWVFDDEGVDNFIEGTNV